MTATTEQDTAAEQRTETAAGLRALADFIESHDTTAPGGTAGPIIYDYQSSKDAFLAQAEALGGPWEQKNDGQYFTLNRAFGPIRYQLYTTLDVVGRGREITKPVTEWTLDDDVLAALAGEEPSA